MKCPSCLNECRDDTLFCNICGTRLIKPEKSEPTFTAVTTPVEPVEAASASATVPAFKPQEPTSDQQSGEYAQGTVNMPNTNDQVYSNSSAGYSSEYTQHTSEKAQSPVFESSLPPANSADYSRNIGFEPISTGGFMLMDLIMAIPVLNIVMYFVWGFSKNVNPNKSNWAKSKLLWILIGLAFSIIVIVVISILFSQQLQAIFGLINEALENLATYIP